MRVDLEHEKVQLSLLCDKKDQNISINLSLHSSFIFKTVLMIINNENTLPKCFINDCFEPIFFQIQPDLYWPVLCVVDQNLLLLITDLLLNGSVLSTAAAAFASGRSTVYVLCPPLTKEYNYNPELNLNSILVY